MNHKWIGPSARLTSPENSPSGISHLLVGCSVPLWLQNVLQTLVSERKSEELQACHLPLMGRQCPFLTVGPVPAVGTSGMSGVGATMHSAPVEELRAPFETVPLLKGFRTFWRGAPGSQGSVTAS